MKKHIIISIVVLITAIIAVGVFLCVTQDKHSSVATETKIQKEEGNIIENDGNATVLETDEIKVIENEIWDQLLFANQVKSFDRDQFFINVIDEDRSIALGTFVDNNYDYKGINVFAYRIGSNEEWSIEISSVGLTCSQIALFSDTQFNFLRKYYSGNCVDYDKNGNYYQSKI